MRCIIRKKITLEMSRSQQHGTRTLMLDYISLGFAAGIFCMPTCQCGEKKGNQNETQIGLSVFCWDFIGSLSVQNKRWHWIYFCLVSRLLKCCGLSFILNESMNRIIIILIITHDFQIKNESRFGGP